MKKKLLIGLASFLGIFIIIGIIAVVTAPEKPALTPSEQAYATTILDQTTTVSKATTELVNLFQNPQIGNDQWTLRVAAQLATIRVLYDKAMELDPPSSMAEIHLKHTQAMKHLNDATYLIAQGIGELDPSLLDAATQKILTATQLIKEGTQLMLEFKETHK